MALSVEVAPGAKQDLSAAYHWYKERSIKAADSFRTEVLAAFDRVANNPESWAVWESGIRRFVLTRYPYTVYFEADQATVRILAVGHHRQRPNYWAGR